MMEQYNYQLVVLKSDHGIKKTEGELYRQVEKWLLTGPKHYRLLHVKITGVDTASAVVDTDEGTAKDEEELINVWNSRLTVDEMRNFKVAAVYIAKGKGKIK
jgi:hypothetical protein